MSGPWIDATSSDAVAAYAAGWLAALEHVAAGHAELHAVWKPIGRLTYQHRVAERLALFEDCARQLHERLGRPAGYQYTGGAVDWQTGGPVREGRVAA